MPQIANITVKKYDGTTDVTYTAMQPSAGDNQPAIWKETNTGTVRAGNPELALVARSGGNRRVRRITGSYIYPKVRLDSASQAVVSGGMSASFTVTVPQEMTATEIRESTSQFANLVASALVKSCLETGFSAS